MVKMLKKFTAATLAFLLLFSMSTVMLRPLAEGESQGANDEHTVKFYYNDGTTTAHEDVQTVNGKVTLPSYDAPEGQVIYDKYKAWYLDQDCTGEPVGYPTKEYTVPEGSPEVVNLYAGSGYDVTFDMNVPGPTPKENVYQFVLKGHGANQVEDPIYPGFYFAGWYTEKTGGEKFNFETQINAETTVYAHWDPAPNVDVEIHPNNGEEPYTLSALYDSTVGDLKEPEWGGHTFVGWYSDENLSNPVDNNEIIEEEPLTLYAKWEINTCKVTFDPNNGQDPTIKEVYYGSLIDEPEKPIKEGYEFAGWYIINNTNPFDFEHEQIKGDTTLLAHWICTVTFVPNNGQENFTQKVEEGTLANKPDDPTYEGHTFEGWYSDEGLTQAFDFNNAVVEKNMSLYAKWSETKADDPTKNNDNNDSAKSVLTGQSLAMIWTFVAIALIAVIAVCATVFYRKKHKN